MANFQIGDRVIGIPERAMTHTITGTPIPRGSVQGAIIRIMHQLIFLVKSDDGMFAVCLDVYKPT